MLMGTYTPKLDDKGRLFLPAKFRDQLAEGLVVTRDRNAVSPSGRAPPSSSWPTKAQEAPVTDKAARDYTRLLFAGASDDQPDKQGRLTIPPMLREYAVAHQGRGRDRGREPARDLGRRQLADVLRRARGRRSPTSAKRSSRRRLTGATAPQLAAHNTTDGSHGEVSGPLLVGHLGHLPRHQTSTSHITRTGSGQGPGRAIQYQHRTTGTTST